MKRGFAAWEEMVGLSKSRKTGFVVQNKLEHLSFFLVTIFP